MFPPVVDAGFRCAAGGAVIVPRFTRSTVSASSLTRPRLADIGYDNVHVLAGTGPGHARFRNRVGEPLFRGTICRSNPINTSGSMKLAR
jgi:hypothetical protein